MISATTVLGVALLIPAVVALVHLARVLARSQKTIAPAIVVIFAVLTVALYGFSAKWAVDAYHAQIVRRDTWTRVLATVTQQSPGGRDTPCYVTYSFIPKAAGPQAPVTSTEDLETRDECDQYGVGKLISIHYAPGKPKTAMLFLHGDDSTPDRIRNFTFQSVLADLMLTGLCILGWGLTNWMYCLFFARVAANAKETPSPWNEPTIVS